LGDLNLTGGAGRNGLALSTIIVSGADGGASFFGAGAAGKSGIGAGNSTINPGAGGSGGAAIASGSAAAGGNGGDGFVIVYEYN
jgi:hypothetical protein